MLFNPKFWAPPPNSKHVWKLLNPVTGEMMKIFVKVAMREYPTCAHINCKEKAIWWFPLLKDSRGNSAGCCQKHADNRFKKSTCIMWHSLRVNETFELLKNHRMIK